MDPKRFGGRRKNDNTSQKYTLNEKSDVYSVGVLFWEISSGRSPFYVEGEQYDIDLAIEISNGLREKVVPGTPEDYVKIYTGKYDLKYLCYNLSLKYKSLFIKFFYMNYRMLG